MNRYTRVYWLCLLGAGLLLTLQWLPRVTGEPLAVGTVAPFAGGVAATVAAGYALATGQVEGAPEEPNALFAVVVVAFLVVLGSAVVQVAGVV